MENVFEWFSKLSLRTEKTEADKQHKIKIPPSRARLSLTCLPSSQRANDTIESATNSIGPLMDDVDYNLAAGMPYWYPSTEHVKEALNVKLMDPDIHLYGDIEGNKELLQALAKKLKEYNGIEDRNIMVTVGATQGFMNLCQALFDPEDEVILFSPFYFNQKMALQLCNIVPVEVPMNLKADSEDFYDLDAFRKAITHKTRGVVFVNPHNPTGCVAPDETVKEIQKICEQNRIYMISDEAYESFYYGKEPKKHYTPVGPNVINLYTFSKAFGMCGWRCGYIVYPNNQHMVSALEKIQDSIPMHVPHMTQRMAQVAIEQLGISWTLEMAKTLEENRELIYDAISVLPDQIPRTSGSIYIVARLPHGIDDTIACAFLSKEFGVIALPCTTLGAPGFLRICFAFMKGKKMKQAAEKLKLGFAALLKNPDLSSYGESNTN